MSSMPSCKSALLYSPLYLMQTYIYGQRKELMTSTEPLCKNEVCVDDNGVPIFSRFIIFEPITKRAVAVVEAYTPEHARERFAVLAPYLRESFLGVLGEYFHVATLEGDADEKAFPLFHNSFFDAVEATVSVKH